MLPKGFLVGNVTVDPQSGVTQSSRSTYARFSVACNESFSKFNTLPKDHYFNCVAWGKRAQFVQNFIKKGDKVFIEYSLISNSYVNQEGKTVKTVDLFVENIEGVGQRTKRDSPASGKISNEKVDVQEDDIDNISLDDIFE